MTHLASGGSVGLMVAAIVIVVCFALMAAAWSWPWSRATSDHLDGRHLIMAFGGSRWTKDMAVSTVRYAVSVGAKLIMSCNCWSASARG